MVPLREFTVPLVEKYISDLLTTGRLDGSGGLSAKTATDILVIIKSIVKYAEVLDAKFRCNLKGITIRADDREMRVLTRTEQDKLTAFLMQNADRTKVGVLLCLYTGIRVGELCALRWEHISLAEKTIFICGTAQRVQDFSDSNRKTHVTITSPKSKSSIRKIPLPDFLVEQLRPFMSGADTYLLTGTARVFEPRTIQNRFKKYLQLLELPDCGFHTLRHTFATRCVELGFEIKSLSEILGHADIEITLNRYVHSSMDLKRVNMDKVAALLCIISTS
jgi:integrase